MDDDNILRVMNQQMADLIALAHDAIIVRNLASNIVSWNQGAQQVYGWSADEAIGQISHELLKTRFPQSRDAIFLLLERQGQWKGQLIHTHRDGTQVIVESHQMLVRDESGKPTAILEINRDITEREQMQRQQTEAHAREMALRETQERMDEFLGIVSHELRTPLTTIKGNIQLARMRLSHARQYAPADNEALLASFDEIKMMLDRAERQVNVQNRLVRDLMDVARIQADKLELQPEQCDLVAIVYETVEDLLSATPTRAIHLDVPGLPAGETIQVFADAERIAQVISNYVTNALKYSPEDRPVEVRLEKADGKARVSVRDEGPGLSRTEQERVWERFYRVEGVVRQRGFGVGMGLGLHICRAIIEQNQGEVGVESVKGEGSTFWFTLPLR
ncbi:MAG TPA: ATP-binding protein [Ktedonobacteraceae bacterium]|nr:ATP-binding protein [Ktedonobacteraceae bacterium]